MRRIGKQCMRWFLLILVFPASLVYSHGTAYEIIRPDSITIRASFDTGEPIAHTDVLVFPPDQTEAQSEVTTDANGIFAFSPDRPGTWSLQVRGRGGHGMRINLDINQELLPGEPSGSGRVSYLQKIVMAACVVWGLTGTALFFSRKKA
ncbi:MAG: carboxypeptidase regulatory-like domain-containing protein [Chitinivibrionales bacterium]|nr:carboxypeptidase regulatory-like domain-containing protein [Chitinivibrionales bacterium]